RYYRRCGGPDRSCGAAQNAPASARSTLRPGPGTATAGVAAGLLHRAAAGAGRHDLLVGEDVPPDARSGARQLDPSAQLLLFLGCLSVYLLGRRAECGAGQRPGTAGVLRPGTQGFAPSPAAGHTAADRHLLHQLSGAHLRLADRLQPQRHPQQPAGADRRGADPDPQHHQCDRGGLSDPDHAAGHPDPDLRHRQRRPAPDRSGLQPRLQPWPDPVHPAVSLSPHRPDPGRHLRPRAASRRLHPPGPAGPLAPADTGHPAARPGEAGQPLAARCSGGGTDDPAPAHRGTGHAGPGLPQERSCRMNPAKPRPNLWLYGYVGVIFAFVFTPIITTVVFAFDVNRYPSLPMGGLTLDWFRQVLADASLSRGVRTSLSVALCSAVVATALGFAGAYVDYR